MVVIPFIFMGLGGAEIEISAVKGLTFEKKVAETTFDASVHTWLIVGIIL